MEWRARAQSAFDFVLNVLVLVQKLKVRRLKYGCKDTMFVSYNLKLGMWHNSTGIHSGDCAVWLKNQHWEDELIVECFWQVSVCSTQLIASCMVLEDITGLVSIGM